MKLSKKVKGFLSAVALLAAVFVLDYLGVVESNEVISDILPNSSITQSIDSTTNASGTVTEDAISFTVEGHIFTVPSWDGDTAFCIVNDNIPFFTEEEKEMSPFESYSDLDSLGRCGVATACVGIETMPTEKRESISSVKPSGWNNKPYDWVDGGYLYNRCHLIGFQLTGENANKENLITGTRYLNVEGMLPFENMVADYVKETEDYVMYRVTPLYVGNNLVAHGVLMEAFSVGDKGEAISYNVYCYNVQPGVEINYATGDNRAA